MDLFRAKEAKRLDMVFKNGEIDVSFDGVVRPIFMTPIRLFCIEKRRINESKTKREVVPETLFFQFITPVVLF